MTATLIAGQIAIKITSAVGQMPAISLLTGGQDRHYAHGLAMSLAARGVNIDVVGSASEDGPEMHETQGLHFLELYGSETRAGLVGRLRKILRTYWRLLAYIVCSHRPIVHILWDYKLPFLDRVLFPRLLHLLGKRVVLTAHNINAARRDGCDSWLNRVMLGLQYRSMDCIFVHTGKMRDELVADFRVDPESIVRISYGVNNAIPETCLTRSEARNQLGLSAEDKVVLFFGAIKPYKGLDYLVAAFEQLAPDASALRLVIAGERKIGWESCWDPLNNIINQSSYRNQYLRHIKFIPDSEVELYFKAADVVVLPYTEIFQSGILFLAYAYGLPVIATDVGSFSEDIVEGVTGFICKPQDTDDLARAIQRYFESGLYKELETRRQNIRDHVLFTHSWDLVAEQTINVYADLTK